ncbi:c-type cytochrome [Nitrospira moscoviensis]|uniref:Cytochrome c551 n=1 Tax=Nitrospira moscoviensis TaxID=42253 RepID=A0A0K2GI84_NITMO|nr:cytochrome c [Nitrospira moscoviensis]ALA60327.1 cytochrome c551 [Nitrospira moscoviensis]
MKRRPIMAMCLLAAAAGVQAAPSGHTDSRTSPAGDPAKGEELYNASCVVCHGPRAAGGIGPRLAGNPVLSNDKAFDRILSEGRHMMPPLKDTVTSKQLADIRAWLQTLP